MKEEEVDVKSYRKKQNAERWRRRSDQTFRNLRGYMRFWQILESGSAKTVSFAENSSKNARNVFVLKNLDGGEDIVKS